MTAPLPSYTSAVSDTPLLGETIGANLRRTVARHGDREALQVVPRGLGHDEPLPTGRRGNLRRAPTVSR
jgi:hypothetical protein